MILHPPFIIGSRLLPCLKIGNCEVSLEYASVTDEGRTRYRYYIDTEPGYTDDDLKSGCQGGNLQEGFASLLSFLSACAEAGYYHQCTGRSSDNIDLFPNFICDWAMERKDEIDALGIELEQSKTLIEE